MQWQAKEVKMIFNILIALILTALVMAMFVPIDWNNTSRLYFLERVGFGVLLTLIFFLILERLDHSDYQKIIKKVIKGEGK